MGTIDDITREIKGFKFSNYLIPIILFLGTLAPGFLLLYLYKPDMIKEFSSFKLCIFSLCLTIPIVVLNTTIVTLFSSNEWYYEDKNNANGNDDIFEMYIIGGLGITFFLLYSLILCAYLFRFTFKNLIIILVILEFILLIISILYYFNIVKKR